jgi:hypothetical protein
MKSRIAYARPDGGEWPLLRYVWETRESWSCRPLKLRNILSRKNELFVAPATE